MMPYCVTLDIMHVGLLPLGLSYLIVLIKHTYAGPGLKSLPPLQTFQKYLVCDIKGMIFACENSDVCLRKYVWGWNFFILLRPHGICVFVDNPWISVYLLSEWVPSRWWEVRETSEWEATQAHSQCLFHSPLMKVACISYLLQPYWTVEFRSIHLAFTEQIQ